MRQKNPLILAAFLALLLTCRLCRADEAGDLELILARTMPCQPFTQPSFLQPVKVLDKDTMYEGRLGDIDIVVWVENGTVDSVFLTVKGKRYTAWVPVVTEMLGPPSVNLAGEQGQILRYRNDNYEYYLVFVNNQGNRNYLTDLSLFRYGPEHAHNGRYHESGDIWEKIFSPPR